jgi:hypothetical protein
MLQDQIKKYFPNLLLLLVDFGLLFLTLFLATIFIGNGQQLAELKKRIFSFDLERESSLAALQDFNRYQPELQEIKNSFILGSLPLDFIKFLEAVSAETGFKIKIVPGIVSQSKAAAEDANWPFINFQVSGQGTPGSLLVFLKKIETGPYLAKIIDFTAKKIGENQVEIYLTARVFSR